jgi:radical SAM superfamily enzyme YgiQ (UPF0313 family)
MPAFRILQRSKFLVELIKPSHYDDEGYVIQWRRGFIPSNSLCSLYGLVLDAAQRRILGAHVDIRISVRDETNSVIRIKRIIRRFRRNFNRGLVCLVGVQTNQFPRALDIAREFRVAGIQVAIGGFHVSGCIAMLPALTPELTEALGLGITLFAGEAEGHLDELLRASNNGKLQPIYNYMAELPRLENQPVVFLPRPYIRRYVGRMGCFDAGRGCPFSCSFCTIINVQGRKSRFRTADDVEKLMRANIREGARSILLTDDNFARNKNWENIFDRLIELRATGSLCVNFTLQVDMLSHKIPNFISKAARAGCDQVYIGLESINPESLNGASKGQNRITEYRRMLQAWRAIGAIVYGGYILGFPEDTPGSVTRDISIIQRELPIDMLHFFMLTPLPGCKDHRDLFEKGAWLEPDLNRYDTEHPAALHQRMTAQQWEYIYQQVWQLYYSWEHIETLLRRAVATGSSTRALTLAIFQYSASPKFERVHPLQSGLFRRKVRNQRRNLFPQESPVLFYPRRIQELLTTNLPALIFYFKLQMLRRRVEREARLKPYSDIAINPVRDSDDEKLDLYEQNEAARHAVGWSRRHAHQAQKLKP